MALPVQHEALQQIGPAQERRILRRAAADHDVIAAAGAGVAAVDQELVGAEPRLGGVLIEAERDVDRLAPVLRRLDVDLDHAGIGRHLDHLDARIVRRRIALDMHLHLQFLGGRLDRRDQFEIILQLLDRRHEGAQHAVADFDRHRGAHRRLALLLPPASALRSRLRRRDRPARRAAPADPARRCRDILPAERIRSEPIGSRRPSGESPGDQEQIAAPQLPALAAPAPGCALAIAFQRWIGSTKPLGAFSPCSNTRAMRERSSGSDSFESAGSTLAGSAGFLLHPVRGVLVGRQHVVGTEPESLARCLRRSARRPSISALRGFSIFAIRSAFFQIGTPSLRQYSPNAQRGRLSPGYHLPCP